MDDIRRAAPKSKVLNRDRARFEVAAGNYRLIAAFDFRRQIVFVKSIGTHAEYDAIDALMRTTSASVYAFQGAPFVFFAVRLSSLKYELCKRARHSPLFLFRLWTGSPIDTKLIRRVRSARMRFHKLRHDHNARNRLLDHIDDCRFGLQRTWWGSSSGSPRSRLLRD